MYLNYFSVRIPEGYEDEQGYVHMKHNQIYKIMLRNNRHLDALAKVFVDGKEIGLYFVKNKSNLTIERPLNDDGKFTFYSITSNESKELELEQNDKLGLITVIFTPIKEKTSCETIFKILEIYKQPIIYQPIWYRQNIPYNYNETLPIWYYNENINNLYHIDNKIEFNCCTQTNNNQYNQCAGNGFKRRVRAGGTGLSGKSTQEFYEHKIDENTVYLYEEQTTIHLRLICSNQKGKKIRKLNGLSTLIPPAI